MITKNLRMSRTLVGTSISFIPYNFDDRSLTPLLLTQKPIYSFPVLLNIEFLNLLLIPILRVFVGISLMRLDVPQIFFSRY